MKFNGWSNWETWNVALWLQNIEGSSNRWCESTQAMSLSEWRAMLLLEFPVTGDDVSLENELINWEEIYSSIKSDWKL